MGMGGRYRKNIKNSVKYKFNRMPVLSDKKALFGDFNKFGYIIIESWNNKKKSSYSFNGECDDFL